MSGLGFRIPALSILSIEREVKEDLISSIQRLAPEWSILIQRGAIRQHVDAIFFQLARVASNEQVVNGIEEFIKSNGSLSTLSTDVILTMFVSEQLGIPPYTYNKIQEGINENIAEIALIAFTVKTIGMLGCDLKGFNAPEETPFEFLDRIIYDEIVYEYLSANIRSFAANPYLDQTKIRALLRQIGLFNTTQCIEDLYGAFASLKYMDITNCNYTQPLRIPNIKILPESVTTIISDRLQIPTAGIQNQVDALTDEQLTSLVINIDRFPRLRTAIIKLGFEQLDQAIVDALMVDKFRTVRTYFTQAVTPDKSEEAGVLFTNTLMRPDLREYTPILLEMNYQSPGINQSVADNLARSKINQVQPLLDFMYSNLSLTINWLIPSHVLPPQLEKVINDTIINKRRGKQHIIITDKDPVKITPTTICYGLLRYN